MNSPTIVFADIDHVPLAIDDSHRRLPELLTTLAAERIVLVFCSSRTRAEVEGFRQSIGIFHPFICEGGSVAFVPGHYFGSALTGARCVAGYDALEFGLPYGVVVDVVHRTADQLRLGIRGFSDMSVEQVARECGISLLAARLAKLREYSEPFRLLREDAVAERRLIRELESLGLVCVRRGAFLHAVSVPDAARSVDALRKHYQAAFGDVVVAPASLVEPTNETLTWIEHIVERVSGVSGGEIQCFRDGTAAAARAH